MIIYFNQYIEVRFQLNFIIKLAVNLDFTSLYFSNWVSKIQFKLDLFAYINHKNYLFFIDDLFDFNY